MNKATTALFIVAIMVLGTVAVITNGSVTAEDVRVPGYPDSHLTVLGNADGDERFTPNDIAAIQDFISSGEAYDRDRHFMFDADFDGKVDQSDIDKVSHILDALSSGDWSSVGTVHYVNVDHCIVGYDMTLSDRVITLIAPPLDSVLALGGRDLVVGFDDRIYNGKYHSEYARTFDFDRMYNVGNCNDPSSETISRACKDLGSVNIVCGTRDSYGPTLETVFNGTGVQVIRIASWEFGGTLYGFMTLGFLLKRTAEAEAYLAWYDGVHQLVRGVVESVDPSKRSAGEVGAACVYGYLDELSLLGNYTGEYANLMVLDPYDSAEAYLHGKNSGGHGDTITGEGVSAMFQQNHLRHLLIMLGTPFQVYAASGDASATAANFTAMYDKWEQTIGLDKMPGLEVCVTGFSFSSGVSEVLNQLIHCYYLYTDEFLAYNGVDLQGARDLIAGYVDHYCSCIGIDDLWSFYGEDNGGRPGTHGMNLLYCGEGDERNLMFGPVSGSIRD